MKHTKTCLAVLAIALLVTMSGCFLFGPTGGGSGKYKTIPAGMKIPSTKDQEPEKPKAEIDKPDIPEPDEETAAKIKTALDKYLDEELGRGERQDALLGELAALGTIAYADVLRMLADSEDEPGRVTEIFKYFHSQPKPGERDRALVVQLFNDDENVRCGAGRALGMLHKELRGAFDADADEQARYEMIQKIKKTLKIK